MDDVRVEHGQPLGDQRQASHAGEHLQGGLHGAGLQQGLVRGVGALLPGGHGLVLGTAAQHLAVLHCRVERRERERERATEREPGVMTIWKQRKTLRLA